MSMNSVVDRELLLYVDSWGLDELKAAKRVINWVLMTLDDATSERMDKCWELNSLLVNAILSELYEEDKEDKEEDNE